ncbi:MAG: NAD(P)-binding domain-containing protein, partial [Gammaproteobacteria bacterium]|nr:NAD(P)-binding domain-containing protein [Gammaproteobacteria bacterium]
TDPDGYMTMPEVVAFIASYAAAIGAPVRTGTTVTSVVPDGSGYRVATNRGDWRCRAVVLASGAHNVPIVPAAGDAVPRSIACFTPKSYRNPGQLDERGVLVVGASATGLQLAHEIHRSGRRVLLAVGEHVRMPRLYRGRDIQWWMHAAGILDERYDEVDDIDRARRVPSPQLVGTPQRMTLDLNALTDIGVEIVGRLADIVDGKARFSGSLRNHCASADLKLGRLLDRIDGWMAETGGSAGAEHAEAGPPERFAPTRVPSTPRTIVDLERDGIGTIVWATGLRPDYSWLHVPVLDRKGRLRHDGGIVDAPGMYALGLNFMRRRKSSFIHGAGDDAGDLADHLMRHLRTSARAVAIRAAG